MSREVTGSTFILRWIGVLLFTILMVRNFVPTHRDDAFQVLLRIDQQDSANLVKCNLPASLLQLQRSSLRRWDACAARNCWEATASAAIHWTLDTVHS